MGGGLGCVFFSIKDDFNMFDLSWRTCACRHKQQTNRESKMARFFQVTFWGCLSDGYRGENGTSIWVIKRSQLEEAGVCLVEKIRINPLNVMTMTRWFKVTLLAPSWRSLRL